MEVRHGLQGRGVARGRAGEGDPLSPLTCRLQHDPHIPGSEGPLSEHDQVLPGRDKKVGNGKGGRHPTSIRTSQVHPEGL